MVKTPRVAAALFSLVVSMAPMANGDGAFPEVRHYVHGAWSVAESPNFRMYHHEPEEQSQTLLLACEAERSRLKTTWISEAEETQWVPKCVVWLHQSPESFSKHSGYPPETEGIANLEIGDGRVWERQIHVRCDRPALTSDFLMHELVHVVLADRFASRRVAPWADEGIALLHETGKRHAEYQAIVLDAHRGQYLFSLSSLLGNQIRPRSKTEVKLFYGQSASLVSFLTLLDSRQVMLRFVEALQSGDADLALKTHYGIRDVAELERKYDSFLKHSLHAADLFVLDK
jgi:hypothetical protein